MRIAVVPGDGIGPEVTAQSVRVLNALRDRDFDFELREWPAGAEAYQHSGVPLPQSTRAAVLEADAVLFGAIGDARFDHLERRLRPEQAILEIRGALGLYAGIRHIRIDSALAHLSPLQARLAAGTDIMLVRELAGDVYTGTPRGQRIAEDGFGSGEPEGFDTMRYSRPEVRRVAHAAFKIARSRSQRLHSVDKANVLETSRLWRNVLEEVGADYPDVRLTHIYADTAGMELVSRPSQFDTIVAPNLFGDMISDLASALSGSVALCATAMLGSRGTWLFEPGHGSAMDIAGRGTANPIASLRAAALLLRHAAGRDDLALRVERAIQSVMKKGLRTSDIQEPGTTVVGTKQIGDAIVHALNRNGSELAEV